MHLNDRHSRSETLEKRHIELNSKSNNSHHNLCKRIFINYEYQESLIRYIQKYHYKDTLQQTHVLEKDKIRQHQCASTPKPKKTAIQHQQQRETTPKKITIQDDDHHQQQQYASTPKKITIQDDDDHHQQQYASTKNQLERPNENKQSTHGGLLKKEDKNSIGKILQKKTTNEQDNTSNKLTIQKNSNVSSATKKNVSLMDSTTNNPLLKNKRDNSKNSICLSKKDEIPIIPINTKLSHRIEKMMDKKEKQTEKKIQQDNTISCFKKNVDQYIPKVEMIKNEGVNKKLEDNGTFPQNRINKIQNATEKMVRKEGYETSLVLDQPKLLSKTKSYVKDQSKLLSENESYIKEKEDSGRKQIIESEKKVNDHPNKGIEHPFQNIPKQSYHSDENSVVLCNLIASRRNVTCVVANPANNENTSRVEVLSSKVDPVDRYRFIIYQEHVKDYQSYMKLEDNSLCETKRKDSFSDGDVRYTEDLFAEVYLEFLEEECA